MSQSEVQAVQSTPSFPLPKFSKTQFQESVFQDSILLEALPDAGSSGATRAQSGAVGGEKSSSVPDDEKFVWPLLGTVSVTSVLRNLYIGLALFLAFTFTLTYYAFAHSEETALKIKRIGDALVQAQRLATSANEAFGGGGNALEELRDSAAQLKRQLQSLEANPASQPLYVGSDADTKARLAEVMLMAERSAQASAVLWGQKDLLVGVNASLQALADSSDGLLNSLREVTAAKMKRNATPNEIALLVDAASLAQRLAKSASQSRSAPGGNPQALLALRQDATTLASLLVVLLESATERKITPVRDAELHEQLATLALQLKGIRQGEAQISENLPRLASARQAQALIANESERLRTGLASMGTAYLESQGFYTELRSALGVAAALSMLSIAALIAIQWLGARQRRDLALRRSVEAQELTKVTQQVNDAIQVAILRLMNELQAVAEGDLTRQATVTEDITGAIADSINYTVEELRVLVTNVQLTADRVAKTTAQVGATARTQLLTFNQQLREIRQTGLSVLEMAGRINEVSSRAQQSAEVARQSLEASNSGLLAVQNTIGGMNTLRDQIQETSKRIKRLGESSQEIGEITEIISDITEQTNVLALNAAIQAASAGDAGRGFAVVAEEVQRLAVRSAEATQQIAAIVRAIQNDTQDAIGAMERSAQGVVSGAALSDKAGSALTDIDRITRRVADQVEQISTTASQEAAMANEVAKSIQKIFAVTEQTEKDNLATSAEVQRLAAVANDLRKSVTRFKVS